MNSSHDPFKSSNRSSLALSSHSKPSSLASRPLPTPIPLASSVLAEYDTPNPKKALFDFFTEADSARKADISEENGTAQGYPLDKIAQTYKAAYSYNSMQVQKLKSALKQTKSKADSTVEISEKLAEMQCRVNSIDLEIGDTREATKDEETKRRSLAESIAAIKSSLETEATHCANLNRDFASKQTEKAKLESSLKYTNDRISALKSLFSKLDSGKLNQKEVISELESELRKEKQNRHKLEMDLLATKQTIQREKQILLLLHQQYDSISLAKKCERDDAKEELMDVKREEEHWERELASKRQTLNDLLQKSDLVSAAMHRDKASLHLCKHSLSSTSHSSTLYGVTALWVLCFALGVVLRTAAGQPAGII